MSDIVSTLLRWISNFLPHGEYYVRVNRQETNSIAMLERAGALIEFYAGVPDAPFRYIFFR